MYFFQHIVPDKIQGPDTLFNKYTFIKPFWSRSKSYLLLLSLQSCPTLRDPIDGSPPGSSIPGILQARTLEWAAISFSNARKWNVRDFSGKSTGVEKLPRFYLFLDWLNIFFPRFLTLTNIVLFIDLQLQYLSRK